MNETTTTALSDWFRRYQPRRRSYPAAGRPSIDTAIVHRVAAGTGSGLTRCGKRPAWQQMEYETIPEGARLCPTCEAQAKAGTVKAWRSR
jgi:hypothetical protein